jgi:nicotinate phosphoribosyltransferase
MSELEAFQAFAEIYPDDTVLLVDTLNVLESGVPNAIEVFETLKRKGHKPVGIRLDSGDLAYLSIRSAQLLNRAGFPEVSIVLSSDLDELVIWQIHTQIRQEAPRYGVEPDSLIGRLVFGVGTRMVTSWGQPALGGVYKLVAMQEGSDWKPAIKVSETLEKTLNPGHKAAWRIYDDRGLATDDYLTLAEEDPCNESTLVLRHPSDAGKLRRIKQEKCRLEPLHTEVWKGKRQIDPLPLEDLRERRRADVERLDPGVRRLINPHLYHVSLSPRLWELKNNMIEQLENEAQG